MKPSFRSLFVRLLAVIPLLAMVETAEAGNRRPPVIIVIDNTVKAIVSHL